MLTKLLRTVLVVVAALWVGGLFWIGLVFAPYLFALASRGGTPVPHTGAAADLIGPLLYGSDVLGLVVSTLLVVGLLVLRRRGIVPMGGRLFLGEITLAVAFACAGLNYWLLTPRLAAIQGRLDAAYGGFHLADRADPLYRQFNTAHETSTAIFLAGFVAALLALCCLSQFRARVAASGPATA